MNRKQLFISAVALSLVPLVLMPGRAQNPPSGIPVLTQYVGYSNIYFARSDDASIIASAPNDKKAYREGEWSNVLVAVEGTQRSRTVRSKTEIWTDMWGRPHSLNVLMRQVEFNDALRISAFGSAYRDEKIDKLVAESGVLDRATLAIPYTKLGLRSDEVTRKLGYERSSGAALTAIDPSAAYEKEQFALFVSEKLTEAASKRASLLGAIQAVRTTQTTNMPVQHAHKNAMDGLSMLEFSWAGLRSTNPDESGNIRYLSHGYAPEQSVKEFIDPAGMTPAVVADLREKETAAAKAVGEAESLFKDLFTPP